MADEARALTREERNTVAADVRSFNDAPMELGWVLSKQGKSIQSRILVCGRYRCFLLKKKSLGGFQVERATHLFDLKGIQSDRPNHLRITFPDWELDARTPIADDYIFALRQSRAFIAVGFPESFRMRVNVPEDRLKAINLPHEFKEFACGGLLEVYKAFCNRKRTLPSAEFVTFMGVEHQAVPLRRELNLSPLAKAISVDAKRPINLIPLAAALEFNRWYLTLVISQVKRPDLLNHLGRTVTGNHTLRKLKVTACSCNDVTQFARGLLRNKKLAIVDLDLSFNPIGPKGFQLLVQAIGDFAHITSLRFAKCGLNGKSIGFLNTMLDVRRDLAAELEEVSLSYNDFSDNKGRDIVEFVSSFQFVANHRLRTLGLAAIKVPLAVLADPLNKLPRLTLLDLSRNTFDKKSGAALVALFKNTKSIADVKLNYIKTSADILGGMFDSLCNNVMLHDLKVSLSGVDLSSSAHLNALLKVLKTGYPKDRLHTLTVNNCKLGGAGITMLATQLSTTAPGLRAFHCNNNIKANNRKDAYNAARALNQLLTALSNFESLHVAGNGKDLAMGVGLQQLLEAVPMSSLFDLDISNNLMTPAKGKAAERELCSEALLDALTKSTTIRSLHWDGNGTSFRAFVKFEKVMQNNHSLVEMPFPRKDFNAAVKAAIAASPRKEKDMTNDASKAAFSGIVASMRRNKKAEAKRVRDAPPDEPVKTVFAQYYAAEDASDDEEAAPPPLPPGDTEDMELMEPTLLTMFNPAAAPSLADLGRTGSKRWKPKERQSLQRTGSLATLGAAVERRGSDAGSEKPAASTTSKLVAGANAMLSDDGTSSVKTDKAEKERKEREAKEKKEKEKAEKEKKKKEKKAKESVLEPPKEPKAKPGEDTTPAWMKALKGKGRNPYKNPPAASSDPAPTPSTSKAADKAKASSVKPTPRKEPEPEPVPEVAEKISRGSRKSTSSRRSKKSVTSDRSVWSDAEEDGAPVGFLDASDDENGGPSMQGRVTFAL